MAESGANIQQFLYSSVSNIPSSFELITEIVDALKPKMLPWVTLKSISEALIVVFCTWQKLKTTFYVMFSLNSERSRVSDIPLKSEELLFSHFYRLTVQKAILTFCKSYKMCNSVTEAILMVKRHSWKSNSPFKWFTKLRDFAETPFVKKRTFFTSPRVIMLSRKTHISCGFLIFWYWIRQLYIIS